MLPCPPPGPPLSPSPPPPSGHTTILSLARLCRGTTLPASRPAARFPAGFLPASLLVLPLLPACTPHGPERCDDIKGPQPCPISEMTLLVTGAMEEELRCDTMFSSAFHRVGYASETPSLSGGCRGVEQKEGESPPYLSASFLVDPSVPTFSATTLSRSLGPGSDEDMTGWLYFSGGYAQPAWRLDTLTDDQAASADEDLLAAFEACTCTLQANFAENGASSGSLVCSNLPAVDYTPFGPLTVDDAGPIDITLEWTP